MYEINEVFIIKLRPKTPLNLSNLQTKNTIDRNFGKWPILGKYIWPNAYIGDSYISEINYLQDWITERLAWLDESINTM